MSSATIHLMLAMVTRYTGGLFRTRGTNVEEELLSQKNMPMQLFCPRTSTQSRRTIEKPVHPGRWPSAAVIFLKYWWLLGKMNVNYMKKMMIMCITICKNV